MTFVCEDCHSIWINNTSSCKCKNPKRKLIDDNFTLEQAIESVISKITFKLKRAIKVGENIQMEGENIQPLAKRLDALEQIQYNKNIAVNLVENVFFNIERSTRIDYLAEIAAKKKISDMKGFAELKKKSNPEKFFDELQQKLKDKQAGKHTNEILPINLGGKL